MKSRLFIFAQLVLTVLVLVAVGWMVPSMLIADDKAKAPEGNEEVDVGEVQSFLRDREARLEEQERNLDSKEKEFSSRESELVHQLDRYRELVKDRDAKLASMTKQIEELNREREELKKELDKRRTENDQKKTQSAGGFLKIYESMDAKRAASILNDMSTELAGNMLKNMKPQQASEILGRMNAEKARLITERFNRSLSTTRQ